MYGSGNVTYGDIKLDAAEIQMDLNDNTVFAVGREDSTGVVQGKPVLTKTVQTMRLQPCATISKPKKDI